MAVIRPSGHFWSSDAGATLMFAELATAVEAADADPAACWTVKYYRTEYFECYVKIIHIIYLIEEKIIRKVGRGKKE